MTDSLYEIRYGDFGAYFYDLDLKQNMTLKDVLKAMNHARKCDMCGKTTEQVYCVKCMDNSVHFDRREFARRLREDQKLCYTCSEFQEALDHCMIGSVIKDNKCKDYRCI